MAQPAGSFLSAQQGREHRGLQQPGQQGPRPDPAQRDHVPLDGSDLMPGPIGAGAFWTGMVDFVNGKSAQEVADAIQAAWDKL